ncbi:hypothetical protein [Nocardia sp. NPDC051750]|uniref:hypothetical protein n=1 Tax=Nocardia sp. NPDC051750 TaxID=3364325 RepID=UPI0037A3D0BF
MTVDDDLALARSLLSAILAAVAGSEPGLGWAVAVLRVRRGPIVVVSSAEGLGWIPPGLFLPAEVTVPAKWSDVFGRAVQETVLASEGAIDPARIFAELSAVLPGRSRFRVSALASSMAISDNVRAALGDRAAIEGEVSAAEAAVDLTAPGPGLVDRFEVAGSEVLLRQASAVAESDIRATCLALAGETHERVRDAVSHVDDETEAHREQRQLVLDMLRAKGAVPPAWVDEMRAADAMMAAAQRSRRMDVSHIPIGGRPDTAGSEAVRRMFFERRADELLMLLAAGEPDRQVLRDMFYTYGQVIEHPQFPSDRASGVAVSGMPDGLGANPDSAVSAPPAGVAPSLIERRIVEIAGPEGSALQRST